MRLFQSVSPTTERLTRHVLLPSVLPLILLALAATPKEVFGCANRGYMAMAVVLLSTLGALGTTVRATNAMRMRDPRARWWLFSTIVLLLPALLLAPLA